MGKVKDRKPYFSEKGNPEDYDYMRHKFIIIGIMAVFFVVIIGLVECGVF